MQSLGLSESVPRSENRLKALFWPAIRNETDFDYVTEQGFWVCCVVAVLTFLSSLLIHHPFSGLFEALFFFLAATGVRQCSRAAAITAFCAYLLRILVGLRISPANVGIIAVIFLALLLSTVRATWMAAGWRKGSARVEIAPVAAPTFFGESATASRRAFGQLAAGYSASSPRSSFSSCSWR
ncbi:MAG TPA: hypothetical protein VKX25_08980 [Bryobacteraceae bacterium]|nr:hypothetical protein [Bryobacteraceae bacterium]